MHVMQCWLWLSESAANRELLSLVNPYLIPQAWQIFLNDLSSWWMNIQPYDSSFNCYRARQESLWRISPSAHACVASLLRKEQNCALTWLMSFFCQRTCRKTTIKALDIGSEANTVLPHNLSCLISEHFAHVQESRLPHSSWISAT